VEKKLTERIVELKRAAPEREVELWCEDEARLGLKPIVRRMWALRGQRPVAMNHTRYEWLYIYGFVRPATGATYWLVLPMVSTEAMSLALAEFARDVGAGADKQVVLVVDGAGWHRSSELLVPLGVEVVFLPASTPELQPAERLWPMVREAVANRSFESLDELQERLVERCLQLAEQSEAVQAATNYHWLPAA